MENAIVGPVHELVETDIVNKGPLNLSENKQLKLFQHYGIDPSPF